MSTPGPDSHGQTAPAGATLREPEWRRPLAALTLAWLAFESASGLAIYLLGFSAAIQWTVITHTVLGLVFLLPILAYQVSHAAFYWRRPLTAIKAMGYLASATTAIACVSGVVLAVEALFGRRISYAWDSAHLLSTFAVVAFTLPHVLVVFVRDRSTSAGTVGLRAASRVALVRTAALAATAALLTGACWVLYPGVPMNDTFPADYSFKYGPGRPFAPSLARTQSGGAYDARTFAGSFSCGTARCHEDIVAEWSVSAHRWAAMDPGFQRIQEEMGKQNGAESTRYCGGCHDPISLFSGTKNLFTEHLTGLAGYQEGVSCLACHSVRKTDLEGNANYVVGRPNRYLFEHAAGNAAARVARDFLIRAYPREHVSELSKRVFKTPEYCAGCHKQFIDQEVNNVGWVQLQNQYDNWRKSHWNHPGDPALTVECRECHMPLRASRDPAAGDALDYNRTPGDGKVRSHRFLGANQFVPAVLKLPGADEQVRLTERWLRGEIEIPEIAAKWARGPAVKLAIEAPGSVAPGEQVRLRAVITSNKVGHDFPTGPLDIIQAWVQLAVTDESGTVLYSTGGMNQRHFVQPGTFLFKAEPVDQYGNLIDRHNLWEMVGVRYRRSLFPGFSDTAEFAFRCPGGTSTAATPPEESREFHFTAPAAASGRLRITARLLYRKIDQYLLNFMFGEASGLTAPVTELALVEKEVLLAVPPAAAPAGATTAGAHLP